MRVMLVLAALLVGCERETINVNDIASGKRLVLTRKRFAGIFSHVEQTKIGSAIVLASDPLPTQCVVRRSQEDVIRKLVAATTVVLEGTPCEGYSPEGTWAFCDCVLVPK